MLVTWKLNRQSKIKLAITMLVVILVGALGIVALTTEKAAGTPIRVACVGDSITEGSQYTNQLRQLLGSEYVVGNFGVSGTTVSLNSAKPYIYQSKFEEAIDFDPDIVVIMLGTNDANVSLSEYDGSFEEDYKQLVASFKNLEGDEQILIVKSPPIFPNDLNLNSTYLASNVLPHIDNIADEMDLPTINVYDSFGNRSDYFYDGIHPNVDGANLIASQIYETIALDEENFG